MTKKDKYKKKIKAPDLTFDEAMKGFAKTDKKEVDKAVKRDSESKKHEQEEGGDNE